MSVLLKQGCLSLLVIAHTCLEWVFNGYFGLNKQMNENCNFFSDNISFEYSEFYWVSLMYKFGSIKIKFIFCSILYFEY